MPLVDVLLEAGALSSDQLEQARALQAKENVHRSLEEILVEQGFISEIDILRATGQLFGMPVIEEVPTHQLDSSLVSKLPVDWARSHHLLPFKTPTGIGVLTADPLNMDAQDDLALIMGVELTPCLASKSTILRSIEVCYFNKEETPGTFIEQLGAQHQPEKDQPSENDLLRISDSAPVTQLVNLILLEALKAKASDIHIEPLEDRLRVRYRIDGMLYEQAAPPKSMEPALISRLKVMGSIDIAEKRLPQDGMARVSVGGREIDIRLSTVPVPHGERMVLRLLDRDATMLPLSALGMPAEVLDPFRGLLKAQQGVILITGPTGSGKTTTLYAALQELDTARMNVLTIEDPIEYQLPDIGQIQVKPKIGLTFSSGLRHILRQDPDVILVGETRDKDTADILIRASLTGHLVFTTLHTNDAVSAVVRLVDMGIEPYLIASSLKASVAQRLVRKLCPVCKTPVTLSPDQRDALGSHAPLFDEQEHYTSKGCDACLSGYRGRAGIYALVQASKSFLGAVREGSDSAALTDIALREGMTTLWSSAAASILNGTTSVEEVLRVLGPEGLDTVSS